MAGWAQGTASCVTTMSFLAVTLGQGQRARPFSPVSWKPGHPRLVAATRSHVHMHSHALQQKGDSRADKNTHGTRLGVQLRSSI